MALPHEMIITHSFAPEDRTTVGEAINKIARQLANSDDGGTSAVGEVEHARDRLSSAEVVFGKHHMTVAVYAPTLEILNRAVVDVTAEMTRLGVVTVREDRIQEASFWAQLPCNFSFIGRACLISSWNFAGLFSAHNFPAGQTTKLHWKLPISLLETTSQTAYYFNFHEADVGHTTIIGPTGSGKTVLMDFSNRSDDARAAAAALRLCRQGQSGRDLRSRNGRAARKLAQRHRERLRAVPARKNASESSVLLPAARLPAVATWGRA